MIVLMIIIVEAKVKGLHRDLVVLILLGIVIVGAEVKELGIDRIT